MIDKSREDLWQVAQSHSPEGYKVVFDANGVATLMESYKHVAPAGKLVIYGVSIHVLFCFSCSPGMWWGGRKSLS